MSHILVLNENITKMYQNRMVTFNTHLQTVPYKSI